MARLQYDFSATRRICRMVRAISSVLRRHAMSIAIATLVYIGFLGISLVVPVSNKVKWSKLYYDQEKNVTWNRQSAFGLSVLSIDFRTFEDEPRSERRVWLDGRSTFSDHASRLKGLENKQVPSIIWNELSSNAGQYRSFTAYDVACFVEIGACVPWMYYGLTQVESNTIGAQLVGLPHRLSPTAIVGLKARLRVDYLSTIGGYCFTASIIIFSRYAILSASQRLRRRYDRCIKCNYPLAGLSATSCPECGAIRAASNAPTPASFRRRHSENATIR